ncbi:hypothetical protein [Catenuloplanes japonicus]|uniref:hypothetical protein n=1 Tax=Catenuloplanes japonicus TaxID=33876 RepID=UPI0005278C22|nr:hypothetical protein [Catenuloplanes japonicus]
MRLKALIFSGVAAVALGGGLATAAFASPVAQTPPPASPQLAPQPDGSIVFTPTQPFTSEGNTGVERRADGTFLIPADTPVEVMPGGWIRIG